MTFWRKSAPSSRFVTVLVAGVLIACGCGQQDAGAAAPPEKPAAAATGAPTVADAARATYHGIVGISDGVTLSDGRWDGKPASGGSSHSSVWLVRGFHLAGDVDGDGRDDAVVMLAVSQGGTGSMVHIAMLARDGSAARNVATVGVGDRVQVRAARIETGRIVLNVVQAGANDAMCCPGETGERIWAFDGGALREVESTAAPGRLSLADLAGVIWVLRYWSWDEPAQTTPEVTIGFGGDRAGGSSGCDHFSGGVHAGEAPGDMSITNVATTLMACAGPAGSIEARFLSQLQAVDKFSFVATRLALNYRLGDSDGTMLFEARTP